MTLGDLAALQKACGEVMLLGGKARMARSMLMSAMEGFANYKPPPGQPAMDLSHAVNACKELLMVANSQMEADDSFNR